MSWLLFLMKRFWDVRNERAEEPPLVVRPDFDADGWAINRDFVTVIPSRAGWYYKKLSTKSGLPEGITWHFTSTGANTAHAMAYRRRDHERKEFADPDTGKMPGSWGFTIARSGQIIQQLSLRQGGFHAGSQTAKKLPIGWANHVTTSIELEGYGKDFPEAQVLSACWLARALVHHCNIQRPNATYEHSKIDPTRKTDPGPVWMEHHMPRVMTHAFEVP